MKQLIHTSILRSAVKIKVMKYKPEDTIDELFIRFFEEHHEEMILRSHGRWLQDALIFNPHEKEFLTSFGSPVLIPYSTAKMLVTNSFWEKNRHLYIVQLPDIKSSK